MLRICCDPRDFGRDEITTFAVSAPRSFHYCYLLLTCSNRCISPEIASLLVIPVYPDRHAANRHGAGLLWSRSIREALTARRVLARHVAARCRCCRQAPTGGLQRCDALVPTIKNIGRYGNTCIALAAPSALSKTGTNERRAKPQFRPSILSLISLISLIRI